MIFSIILKDNKKLPMFISEDEMLENNIIEMDNVLEYAISMGHDNIEEIYFIENKSDETIDLRKIEIDKDALNDYVLKKTGQEMTSFSFPEVGSYEYLLAAIGQKQTSPNLYIKNLAIEFKKESEYYYDYEDYDPYSDEPPDYD